MHRFGCRHSAVGGRGDKLANVLDAIVACHKNALCFGAAILRRDRIACAVQLDQGRKGLILGDPAHGDKQSADLQGAHIALLVGHFDALQTLVGVELGDLAVQNKLHIAARLELFGCRFLTAKGVAAVDQVHLFGDIRHIERILQRRVAAADDRHGLAAEKRAVAGGAVGDAPADELFLAVHAERTVLAAGGDDHRLGFILPLGGHDGFGVAVVADLKRLLKLDLRAQRLCLLIHLGSKIKARDMRRDRVIFDMRCVDDLSAVAHGLQHQHALGSAPRIDRRCETGRTCADNDNIRHGLNPKNLRALPWGPDRCFCPPLRRS